MSTEWLQIIIVLAVFVPLTILTGRYFLWRRWDRERRHQRLMKRRWDTAFATASESLQQRDLTDLEARQITRLRRRYDNPGFSVKVP